MAIMRRRRLEDGTFGDLEKVFDGETQEEKIERIEFDNAQLIYESMMKDSRIDTLITQLTEKGVL